MRTYGTTGKNEAMAMAIFTLILMDDGQIGNNTQMQKHYITLILMNHGEIEITNENEQRIFTLILMDGTNFSDALIKSDNDTDIYFFNTHGGSSWMK